MCSTQHHPVISKQFMMLAKPGQPSMMTSFRMQVILTLTGQGSSHHGQHLNASNGLAITFYRYYMLILQLVLNIISLTLLQQIYWAP